MAKREIPEINAGSMADIAFLLLIFFLVTTTMDRDKAYKRSIPKKIEIEDKPDVEVESRDIMAIRANSKDELMVRDEIMTNPDEISDRILEWFRFNEQSNDLTSNFPLYSQITMDEIRSQVANAEKEFEDAENTPDIAEDFLTFKQAQVDEWKKKERALKLYGKPVLREISQKAHIRVEVQVETGYELFAKIQSEIEEAIFELRDEKAKSIFNEGYGTIITRLAADGEKEDKEKFELLKILYPDRIIEVKPKN